MSAKSTKQALMDTLLNQFIEVDADEDFSDRQYDAMLAAHRATFNGQLRSHDLDQIIEKLDGYRMRGLLEELSSAHSSREEDGVLEYTHLVYIFQEHYAERFYKDHGGDSDPHVLQTVVDLMVTAGKSDSVQLEHEALLDLDEKMRSGLISKADAYATAGSLPNYNISNGVKELVMGHEIGLAAEIPNYVDTLFTCRVIVSSYGGHGSDFDHYVDEDYVERFYGA